MVVAAVGDRYQQMGEIAHPTRGLARTAGSHMARALITAETAVPQIHEAEV